jgi:hypothetical protein
MALSLPLVVVSGWSSQPSRVLSSFHSYSSALDNSDGVYTGIRQYRSDRLPTGLANTNCTSPFTGEPVYQTQWNTRSVNGSDISWVELGTGHQCSGGPTYRYHFWGYGSVNNWHPLGTEDIGTTTGAYDFQIIQSNSQTYNWKVGGVLKASYDWNTTFTDARVGLESYRSGATVSPYVGSSLQYTYNGSSSWKSFAGRDSSQVDTEMCGAWNTDTSFIMGQNTTC